MSYRSCLRALGKLKWSTPSPVSVCGVLPGLWSVMDSEEEAGQLGFNLDDFDLSFVQENPGWGILNDAWREEIRSRRKAARSS